MSLGILIANITGSLRQSASPSSVAAFSAGNVATGAAAAKTNTASAQPSSSAPAIGASQPQLTPNFTVVVLQLLNEQGVVTSTIPSTQQLAAYRAGTAVPPAGS
jgi:hypothetical protein